MTLSAGGRDFKANPSEQRQPPPDLFLLGVWRLVPSGFLVLPHGQRALWGFW
jgi:hypothetical protein